MRQMYIAWITLMTSRYRVVSRDDRGLCTEHTTNESIPYHTTPKHSIPYHAIQTIAYHTKPYHGGLCRDLAGAYAAYGDASYGH